MQTAKARGEEEDSSDDKTNAPSRTRRLSSIPSTNWDNARYKRRAGSFTSLSSTNTMSTPPVPLIPASAPAPTPPTYQRPSASRTYTAPPRPILKNRTPSTTTSSSYATGGYYHFKNGSTGHLSSNGHYQRYQSSNGGGSGGGGQTPSRSHSVYQNPGNYRKSASQTSFNIQRGSSSVYGGGDANMSSRRSSVVSFVTESRAASPQPSTPQRAATGSNRNGGGRYYNYQQQQPQQQHQQYGPYASSGGRVAHSTQSLVLPGSDSRRYSRHQQQQQSSSWYQPSAPSSNGHGYPWEEEEYQHHWQDPDRDQTPDPGKGGRVRVRLDAREDEEEEGFFGGGVYNPYTNGGHGYGNGQGYGYPEGQAVPLPPSTSTSRRNSISQAPAGASMSAYSLHDPHYPLDHHQLQQQQLPQRPASSMDRYSFAAVYGPPPDPPHPPPPPYTSTSTSTSTSQQHQQQQNPNGTADPTRKSSQRRPLPPAPPTLPQPDLDPGWPPKGWQVYVSAMTQDYLYGSASGSGSASGDHHHPSSPRGSTTFDRHSQYRMSGYGYAAYGGGADDASSEGNDGGKKRPVLDDYIFDQDTLTFTRKKSKELLGQLALSNAGAGAAATANEDPANQTKDEHNAKRSTKSLDLPRDRGHIVSYVEDSRRAFSPPPEGSASAKGREKERKRTASVLKKRFSVGKRQKEKEKEREREKEKEKQKEKESAKENRKEKEKVNGTPPDSTAVAPVPVNGNGNANADAASPPSTPVKSHYVPHNRAVSSPSPSTSPVRSSSTAPASPASSHLLSFLRSPSTTSLSSASKKSSKHKPRSASASTAKSSGTTDGSSPKAEKSSGTGWFWKKRSKSLSSSNSNKSSSVADGEEGYDVPPPVPPIPAVYLPTGSSGESKLRKGSDPGPTSVAHSHNQQQQHRRTSLDTTRKHRRTDTVDTQYTATSVLTTNTTATATTANANGRGDRESVKDRPLSVLYPAMCDASIQHDWSVQGRPVSGVSYAGTVGSSAASDVNGRRHSEVPSLMGGGAATGRSRTESTRSRSRVDRNANGYPAGYADVESTVVQRDVNGVAVVEEVGLKGTGDHEGKQQLGKRASLEGTTEDEQHSATSGTPTESSPSETAVAASGSSSSATAVSVVGEGQASAQQNGGIRLVGGKAGERGGGVVEEENSDNQQVEHANGDVYYPSPPSSTLGDHTQQQQQQQQRAASTPALPTSSNPESTRATPSKSVPTRVSTNPPPNGTAASPAPSRTNTTKSSKSSKTIVQGNVSRRSTVTRAKEPAPLSFIVDSALLPGPYPLPSHNRRQSVSSQRGSLDGGYGGYMSGSSMSSPSASRRESVMSGYGGSGYGGSMTNLNGGGSGSGMMVPISRPGSSMSDRTTTSTAYGSSSAHPQRATSATYVPSNGTNNHRDYSRYHHLRPESPLSGRESFSSTNLASTTASMSNSPAVSPPASPSPTKMKAGMGWMTRKKLWASPVSSVDELGLGASLSSNLPSPNSNSHNISRSAAPGMTGGEMRQPSAVFSERSGMRESVFSTTAGGGGSVFSGTTGSSVVWSASNGSGSSAGGPAKLKKKRR